MTRGCSAGVKSLAMAAVVCLLGGASSALAQDSGKKAAAPPATASKVRPPAQHIGPDGRPLPPAKPKPDPVLGPPAMAGDLRRVQALLRTKPEIDAPDELGRTALMLSLARYFPQPGDAKQTGSPAVEVKRQERKLKIARLLLQRGADVRRASTIGMTALHYAVIFPAEEAVLVQLSRELLEKGAPVDARMGEGLTPLRLAVDRGRRQLAALLVAAGANPHVPDNLGKSPLARAEAIGPRELVEALIAKPAAPAAPQAPATPVAPD
jgi:hypothetical protein